MQSKQRILTALRAWIRQRPGLEFGNYGALAPYRAELRQISKDKRDAEALLTAVALRDSITAEDLIAAFPRAYSGRLQIQACAHGETARVTCGKNSRHTWCEKCDPAPSALCHWCHGRGYSIAKPGMVTLNYCTGQYWPTEYRKAACAVLASALWDRARTDAPVDAGPTEPHSNLQNLGTYLRNHFKREFGRSIQQRWFD